MIRKSLLCIFAGSLWLSFAGSSLAQMPGYPAPRYPKIPNITSVEQLMPYARYVVSKRGDKTIVMRPGYNIQGGERVLMQMTNTTDPLVVEAFRRAFVEKNCRVDIIVLQTPKSEMQGEIDGADEMRLGLAALPLQRSRYAALGNKGLQYLPESPADALALSNFIEARKYDLVIGPSDTVGQKNAYVAERMNWFTREMLASPATTFPEEILNLIDRKGWEILRTAKSARLTDPEGSDITWTWFPGYWQVVEGTHPTIKEPGGGPMSGQSGYIYGAGRSEDPLIPGHLMGIPEGIVLPESDAEGVIAGTANHYGPYPHIKIFVKKHEVTEIQGGGEFGRLLKETLDRFKDIKFPNYPRKGYGYVIECAIGTNPKIMRQYNVMETPTLKRQWVDERRRSGIIHWGFGIISRVNEQYAVEHDAPTYHYHTHQYFATYEATMPDGKKVLLINKGRPTMLDDPEVRKVAAKYGDPDELLREDWIPAIPGINVAGDYMKDYGQNPAAYIREEQRKAYPEAIATFNKRGYDIYK